MSRFCWTFITSIKLQQILEVQNSLQFYYHRLRTIAISTQLTLRCLTAFYPANQNRRKTGTVAWHLTFLKFPSNPFGLAPFRTCLYDMGLKGCKEFEIYKEFTCSSIKYNIYLLGPLLQTDHFSEGGEGLTLNHGGAPHGHMAFWPTAHTQGKGVWITYAV